MHSQREHVHHALTNQHAHVVTDPTQRVQVYTVSSLITCFAYVFMCTAEDKTHAVIYHAPSGILDKIPTILKTIHTQPPRHPRPSSFGKVYFDATT